jgi:hypothetical protein
MRILVGSSISLHISAIATRKRVMLSTAPCTTPFSISIGVEYVIPMATYTYSVRFVMNEWVHSRIFPLIFQFFSFLIIPCLQHVSYAFDMSSDSSAAYSLFRIASAMNPSIPINTSIVDFPFRKPYYVSGSSPRYSSYVGQPFVYQPFHNFTLYS